MMLDMGPVGELLFAYFEEFRTRLAEVIEGERTFRRDLGEQSGEMSPYELFSEFRTRLLEPALANLPESAELLDRSARFLLAVSKLSSDPQNIYRDALAVRVFEHLDKPQTDALLGRYPVLTSLVWKGEEERS